MYKKATSGKRKRVILISCLSMLLAACGGGGGGDSQVTVTATAGSGGSITPASQSVNKGSTVTFTLQPNANYTVAYFHAWRSLNNIQADQLITSMPITQ